MFNMSVIMGRLCADPEFNQTQNGVAVCRFRLAVQRPYNKTEQKTDFIPVVVWQQGAEFASRYFRKGMMVIVNGRIQNADYTDNNGVKHYAMEINADNVQFGETKQQAECHQQQCGQQQYNQPAPPQNSYQSYGQAGYGQPAPDYQNQRNQNLYR